MKIMLNAINAIGAGSSVVIRNIIQTLPKVASHHDFTAILPKGSQNDDLRSCKNLKVVFIKRPKNRIISRYLELFFLIPRLCKVYNVDICFTLGDLGPITLDIPQWILLHQPWIVYRDAYVESKWTILEKVKFTYDRFHFRRMIDHCEGVFVQTPVMARRLKDTYGISCSKVYTIPHTVPLHITQLALKPVKNDKKILPNEKLYQFLFLSAGYEHKNHEILFKVVKELRDRRLTDKIHFFTTLDKKKSRRERNLVEEIEKYSDCITNLGFLTRDRVPNAYYDSTALFMPTLAESFGLIFLEAMAYGKPILTSDMDFARWICQDTAWYFDPKDPVSIVDTIDKFIHTSPEVLLGKRKQASKRINDFPFSWEDVSREYKKVLSI